MLIAAAESGARGILCEKPLARTLAEDDAMLDACRRNGVRIAVAHRRANACEQHAEMVANEATEVCLMARCRYDTVMRPQPLYPDTRHTAPWTTQPK